MADYIEVNGPLRTAGEVQISGAKNAALPVLMAALLSPEPSCLENVPNIEDINIAIHLLEHLGAEISFARHKLSVSVPELSSTETSYSLVKALRASFWVVGPLLARRGAARVALPGGDIIGVRPVDIHLAALGQMGADIKVKHGVVYATAPAGLHGAEIKFHFPSVGATHQVMMAAALARGTTVIHCAACEPEVVTVAQFINSMGGDIEGAGTPTIIIHGKDGLGGGNISMPGDRIEAATYLLAGAASGGSVKALGIKPSFLGRFLDILADTGLKVESGPDFVAVTSTGRLRAVNVASGPFPEFATDIQAPLMAALATADGLSRIEENVFEGRFGHVSELGRMGADIKLQERVASIQGVERLTGAPVEAYDIRAGAALVVAALGADGQTRIYEPQHIRRGYEALEDKLAGVGAHIRQRVEDPEDTMFSGC